MMAALLDASGRVREVPSTLGDSLAKGLAKETSAQIDALISAAVKKAERIPPTSCQRTGAMFRNFMERIRKLEGEMLLAEALTGEKKKAVWRTANLDAGTYDKGRVRCFKVEIAEVAARSPWDCRTSMLPAYMTEHALQRMLQGGVPSIRAAGQLLLRHGWALWSPEVTPHVIAADVFYVADDQYLTVWRKPPGAPAAVEMATVIPVTRLDGKARLYEEIKAAGICPTGIYRPKWPSAKETLQKVII